MGPRHGINGQKDVKETKIEHLFLLMGSSLKLVDSAPAGCIIGIGGLDDLLIKTGTISSSQDCPNFIKLQTISLGLVKVTIEAKQSVDDMESLKQGLLKLNKSDPSVQFFINKKGEFILSTCGEVHLERCIKDLNDDFCPGVELTVSEPIIEFRETIINKKLTNQIYKNK
jgi:ribosome assembly protein 1